MPETIVFEDVVVFIVKSDVLQDDVHHGHILSTDLHSLNQLSKELEIEIVATDHFADDHASHSI